MKIGAEEKTKVKVMAVLVAMAVLIIGYNFLSNPSSPATPPANQAQTASTSAAQPKKTGADSNTLDPTLRLDILRMSQNVTYAGSGRNIFRMEAAAMTTIPPPASDVRTHPVVAEVGAVSGPLPLPPPPPIPLRFYGFANRPDEPKRIFLADNSEHFLAKEGDIVERRYRVVQINNASVMVEDMLTNHRQSIPLTPAPN